MAPDDSNSNFKDKDDQSENDDLFGFKDPDVDDDRNQPFEERKRNGIENENLESDFLCFWLWTPRMVTCPKQSLSLKNLWS